MNANYIDMCNDTVGHVSRLQPEVPAKYNSSPCFAASNDTPRQPGWRHPRGRRHISWLHLVRTDLNLPDSDALNLALDRASWRVVATASGLCAAYGDNDGCQFCVCIKCLNFVRFFLFNL